MSEYILITLLIVGTTIFFLWNNRNKTREVKIINPTLDCIIISIGLSELLTTAQIVFNYKADNNGNLILTWILSSTGVAMMTTITAVAIAEIVAENYETKKRDLKYWLICIGCSVLSVGIMSVFLYYGREDYDDETDEVLICTGGSSHAYHLYEDCDGLQACRSDVKIVSLEEALDMGRTPCHYCYKTEPQEEMQQETAPQKEIPQEVYICPSNESNAYHYVKDCKVLRRCADGEDVITVTYEEAQEHERTPCYRCAR